MHIVTDRIPAPGITPDQLLDATTGTDIGTADQGHNPNHIDIGVIVAMTPTEAIPGHIIGHSGCHHRSTSCHCHSTHHFCHDTHTERSSLMHRSSSTHSRDHSRSRPCTAYKPSKKTLSKSSSSSGRTAVKPQDRKHHRVTIDDPQTDYYSSDDTSSDSKDDDGHLN